jgi:DNA invertase Pin-like site-specific DNA recombinase
MNCGASLRRVDGRRLNTSITVSPARKTVALRWMRCSGMRSGGGWMFVLVWRLDRLGRNLKHLISLLDDLQALKVAFVSLNEGIEATTPAGRLQLHILGALAEFERGRIQERVRAGLARAKAQGRLLGRRRLTAAPAGLPAGMTVRAAAAAWGVSKSTAARRITAGVVDEHLTAPVCRSDESVR